MIKAIAIDDEPLALKVIEHFCAKHEGIVLEKAFTKTEEAYKHIKKFPVDLLFLDIQMPGKNGVAFYKSLPPGLMVIFTTAYSEYAVEGFNVNATDYLLKPFSFERFMTAIEKAKKEIAISLEVKQQEHLCVRANYKLHRIPFEEIKLIEGLDDYIKIHIAGKAPLTARMSMKAVLDKLPVSGFVRVHRSYIVPINKIRSVHNKSVTIDDFVIPVGDAFKEDLFRFFNS
ncbi:LytTR family DNA-binding domain-containing protein [Flavobacterium sp.]|uniref:LytR/AlgR family response regulator transcription factor n=1 Tax=Flavobacterium sp. TaxID=239 RepID=UPI0026060258|nr:LytTR family DNA-binding domain-containing protein [Flavobacterium sp.]